MTTAKPKDQEPITVVADEPEPRKTRLKFLGGSNSDRWNTFVANQVFGTFWQREVTDEERSKLMTVVIGSLVGISPKDELEGMMAAQLIAAHNAAMECYRRAMIPEQTFDGRRENLSQANKLSRTYATLIEALNRHRGKGHQKVTVKHVHVHSGAQAVVGVVNSSAPQGGGDGMKSEDQGHAITYAPGQEMPCQNAQRDALPVASDGEWPMQDAWREGDRGAEG